LVGLQFHRFDQAGLLQGFLLSDIHDQRAHGPRLKGTPPLQEQGDRAAVLACLDSHRSGHDYSLLEADIRPETTIRLALGRTLHQPF
jgi:hypothetical protein